MRESPAAGGVATPADAALMMQLGMDGVFVGSGISVESIAELIAHGARGLIVGTSLKHDGRISNPVVPARVRALVDAVRQIG